MKHRRQKHLLTYWRWKDRRQEILADAAALAEAEHRAAIARILAQPTERLPVITRRTPAPPRTAPLMTPGQAARSSSR